MTFETIRLERDQRGIATITLARPDKHNAMNALMIKELTDAAIQLGAEKQVRAVVLAGEGKSFSAGADLTWMRDQMNKDRVGKIEEASALAEMLKTLNDLPKPLIGRVHGPAYGGGIGLMAVCDIVVVAEDARFALTETRLGLIPATIGPFVLRKTGEGLARQIFFTGKSFDARLALQYGLASHVVPLAEIDNAVEAEIAPILKTQPGAVAAAKALCLQLGQVSHDRQFQYSAEALADQWESAEAQREIGNFLAKSGGT